MIIDVEARSAPTALDQLRPTAPVAQRMIDATIAVIDAGGEVAVRVQDIVATVGVQIPVLYRHFGNRDGLVQAAQIERLVRDLDQELTQLGAAFDGASTATEFRALFDELLERVTAPDRAAMRSKRVNILGSAYGRPRLTAAVAAMQVSGVERIVQLFERPQREGWIRADLDLAAFAAWFAGQALGRILIELGDTNVDGDAWNALSAQAVRFVLFG